MRVNLTAAMAVAEAMAVLALAGCGGGGASDDSAASVPSPQSIGTGRATAAAVSAPMSTITVSARGTLANNVGPLMTLRVNGTAIATVEVRAVAYQDYSYNVPAVPAGAKVDVVFSNDTMANGQDRNLFVASITINGTTIDANDAAVSYDRGMGDKAFDGLDVLPGHRSMLWNGALRFTVGGGLDTAGLSTACASFYANTPGFALSSARTVDAIAPQPKPAKGVAFSEPAYKTCALRATDRAADGVPSLTTNSFLRRQPFNANSSKFLVGAIDGSWHTYDANTRARLKQLAGLSLGAEPQWHPSNPDLLYYLPGNWGSGMKLNEMNVSTGASRVVADFSARLKARWPGVDSASTGGWDGTPSKDGRYWCFMAEGAQRGAVGLFTWDRDTDTILGYRDLRMSERPNVVSMSPSGKYCVASFNWESDGASGTVAFTADFKQQVKVSDRSEYDSDLALDANGEDVYLATDQDADYQYDLSMIHLRSGTRTALLRTGPNLRISGKAFTKQGWLVVSTYGSRDDARGWLDNKVMAVQLKANPKVYNLAFHRMKNDSDRVTPLVSVNRDFTKVLFDSNWGSDSDADIDAYMLEVPSGSLKD